MKANDKGIIIRVNKNLYTVSLDTEVFDCRESGKLLYKNVKPTVGDYVLFDKENKIINEILPRKNSLIRPLISNIDKLFIMTSVKKPDFSSFLLDKLILIALSNKIEPIIIFTKEDLLSFRNRLIINKYKKYYKKLGFKVYSNRELNKIKREFNNSVVSLTGQTGAGKSTLLNKLDASLELKTNEISEALGRGKHTTRHVEIIDMLGGSILDTPGFSALEFPNMMQIEIRDAFIEFKDCPCPYRDCMHIKENDCNVKKAVSDGKIADFRYQNYLDLVKTGTNEAYKRR